MSTLHARLLVIRIYKTRDSSNPKIIHTEYKHEHVNKSCVIKPEGCNSIQFRLNCSDYIASYQMYNGDPHIKVPFLDGILSLTTPVMFDNPVDTIITSDFKIIFNELTSVFI